MIWEKYGTLNLIKENAEIVNKNSKVTYYNIASSFDIETSSFYEGDEKRACMYVWAMCIDGHYFTGRTWDEFLTFINKIVEIFKLNSKRRFVIYVHNLAYEMQFIKHYFTFKSVLANRQLAPINCLCDNGIEFRCSYLLSGYALSTLADVYLHGRVKKLVGSVDYSLIRHSATPLDRRDYNYIYNDVRIVYEYINDKIKNGEDIPKIPNTKTGYVRRILKQNCIGGNAVRHMRMEYNHKMYHRMIQRLTISGTEEYELMTRAFQGGFTHCSCINEGKIFYNIGKYDFTSSYPTHLVAYPEYPVSPGRKTRIRSYGELENYCKHYFCIFNIRFTGLRSKIIFEHYLSYSKCVIKGDYIADNGRVVEADELSTTITNIDMDIIKECYEWDSISIGTCYVYIKGYLPTPFVKTILELYEKKTTLKGVAGREAEYQSAKENINALYGACVTAITHDNYKIENGEWIVETPDTETELQRYNDSFNRVLFYPWGICCTALARRSLWLGGILKFGCDYIYSDTDSIAVKNYDTPEHKRAIREYNRDITNKLKRACDFHHIKYDALKPKTIKGEPKPLGVWDFEGECNFKALRSKCYLVEKHGKYELTVSGLNKVKTLKYLHSKYGNDIFNVFNNKLYIPKGHTGKQTHTYINEHIQGDVIDYKGIKGHYDEQSAVHLEPTDYHLELTPEYLGYLINEVAYYGQY